LAVPDAINFQEQNDWAEVRKRCHLLASDATHRITALTGLLPLSPDTPQWFAQMVSVPLPAQIDTSQLQVVLRHDFNIEIPLIYWNGMNLIRLSIQGYNSKRDINALISALTLYLNR